MNVFSPTNSQTASPASLHHRLSYASPNPFQTRLGYLRYHNVPREKSSDICRYWGWGWVDISSSTHCQTVSSTTLHHQLRLFKLAPDKAGTPWISYGFSIPCVKPSGTCHRGRGCVNISSMTHSQTASPTTLHHRPRLFKFVLDKVGIP